VLSRLFPFVTVYDAGDGKSESPSTCNSKSDESSPPHALGSDHERVTDEDVSADTDGVPGDDGGWVMREGEKEPDVDADPITPAELDAETDAVLSPLPS